MYKRQLEHISLGQLGQHFGIGFLGGAKRDGRGHDISDGRGIVRCEHAIGEADVGKVTAGGIGARIDMNRTAGQRESATRDAWLVVRRGCRR